MKMPYDRVTIESSISLICSLRAGSVGCLPKARRMSVAMVSGIVLCRTRRAYTPYVSSVFCLAYGRVAREWYPVVYNCACVSTCSHCCRIWTLDLTGCPQGLLAPAGHMSIRSRDCRWVLRVVFSLDSFWLCAARELLLSVALSSAW